MKEPEQKGLKRRIHEVLEVTPSGGRIGSVFGMFIVSLILLNVAAIMVETVPEELTGMNGMNGVGKEQPLRFCRFPSSSYPIYPIHPC